MVAARAKSVHVLSERSKTLVISGRRGSFQRSPYALAVIDIAFVKAKFRVFWNNFYFPETKVDGSIAGGRRGAHCSTSNLKPEGISELENVVCHDDFQGVKDQSDIHIGQGDDFTTLF